MEIRRLTGHRPLRILLPRVTEAPRPILPSMLITLLQFRIRTDLWDLVIHEFALLMQNGIDTGSKSSTCSKRPPPKLCFPVLVCSVFLYIYKFAPTIDALRLSSSLICYVPLDEEDGGGAHTYLHTHINGTDVYLVGKRTSRSAKSRNT